MTLFDDICEAAIGNYGIVTSSQAVGMGVHLKDMLEWVKLGRMVKCGRGVYRIMHYVPTEYDRYAEAVALVGDDAYIWGESVLAMHNLALVNPEKILIASKHRVRKQLPLWISVIKYPENAKVDDFNGIPCQNIVDAIMEARGKIMTERLAMAVREAETKGLLSVPESFALSKEFLK